MTIRVISLIIISLIRFQGLDLKKKSPINNQRLCALSSDSHGKLRFRQGLDRKSGNLIKEIGRTYGLIWNELDNLAKPLRATV